MPAHRFLAFDLGAESGRGVVGTLDNDTLALEEIHRFANEPVEVCGTLHWDVLALYSNLLKGMRAYVARYGDSVEGVGIDTWGVDFGLLGEDGKLLQNPVHYRDARTEGMLQEAARRMLPEELYRCAGVPLSPVNTSVQLLSLRVRQSPLLSQAKTLLMMPDLFNYFLTGQQGCERTNAVSTQLYDPRKRQWSEEAFKKLDLPLSIMPPLVDPGTVWGELHESVRRGVGLKRGVAIAPCTHDTASAVAAVPGKGRNWAFISSGTWSVVGTLTEECLTSPEAFSAGFFNELTLGSFFLCRNIMGLWLLQQSRAAWREGGEDLSYEALVRRAARIPESPALINPDDSPFLAPQDMSEAIQAFCARTGQRAPQGPGEETRCILESLALSYRKALEDLSRVLGRRFTRLHVVGGGSRNELLCQLTANATGLPVVAGPVEATVAGNVLVQALAARCLSGSGEIRDCIDRSSQLTEYQPRDQAAWEDRYARYVEILRRGAT
ncbi:MAG: rhamnulokinase [Acidobacteriia bacterium]|nr:rhamnulokinase [Terriglobia bacterium]